MKLTKEVEIEIPIDEVISILKEKVIRRLHDVDADYINTTNFSLKKSGSLEDGLILKYTKEVDTSRG